MSISTISSPPAPPPQQFTNAETLINSQSNIVSVMIFNNGVLLTEGLDYTRIGGLVAFTAPPVAGSILTARIFALGLQLGGANPRRYVCPWTFLVTGALDGVSTAYKILFGPTIAGAADGVNRTFTWQVALRYAQIWRNGILQTTNVDVGVGATAMVFLPGVELAPGDVITMLGY